MKKSELNHHRLEKIILVQPRGFCAGVKRAIEAVEQLLERYGPPLYVRHQIVHNHHVVADFEKRGVIFVVDIQQIPLKARVVFSAHGSPPELYLHAKERELEIIDATCPLVTKVHLEAKKFAREGYFIFYIGHNGHPETVGVLGEVSPDKIVLIETLNQAKKVLPPQTDKLVILNQTTLSFDETEMIVACLKQRFPKVVLPLGKDVCYATQNRQEAVKALAKRVDLILVIGSQISSNSQRLCEVAQTAGVKAFLIEDALAIDPAWLRSTRVLGITSGASVPESLISELVEKFRQNNPYLSIEEMVIKDESQIQFALPKELKGA